MPTRDEMMIMERATRLFGRCVTLHSYHDEKEERLDAWFRHSEAIPDAFGLHTQEAVSQFRHNERPNGEVVFGSWAQTINLSNQYLAVTIVHELGHLVDRYHLAPRTAWSSASEQFFELFNAYSQTTSSWIATNALQGRFFYAKGPDGTIKGVPDDPKLRRLASERALEMLKGHEVFARCLTAFVFYEALSNDLTVDDRAICQQFLDRVTSLPNRVTGYDLSQKDYEIVREPMHRLLDDLGWKSENNG